LRGPNGEGSEQGDDEICEPRRSQSEEEPVLKVNVKRNASGHISKLLGGNEEVNPGC